MAEVNLTMRRGDTVKLNITVTRGGSAVDLTGASIWFTVKNAVTDADPGVFQKTVGSGIVVTNAAAGQAQITIANADTSAIVGSRTLLYDIQVKEAGGDITTVANGTITVSPDVTLAIV
jgi:hypothetical protein